MSRRRWWLLGGAVVLLLAVAAGVWWWTATRAPDPDAAALAYVRALESGDPDAVAATGAEVPDAALRAFPAATALIEEAAVETVRVRDDREATAEIAFRLDGQEHRGRLMLTLTDGRWVVGDSALGLVTPSTTVGESVAIGDAALPAGAETALLPGVYTVQAAPQKVLAGETMLTVLPDSDSAPSVDASLRPEATAIAQAELEAHLDACIAPAAEPPPGCGIRIPWGTEFRAVTEVRYRIEQAPTVTLTPTAFTADGGVLIATVTGTAQDGTARTTTYRTEMWSLRGDVSFRDDALVLSVW